jgi:hypothetical protein
MERTRQEIERSHCEKSQLTGVCPVFAGLEENSERRYVSTARCTSPLADTHHVAASHTTCGGFCERCARA